MAAQQLGGVVVVVSEILSIDFRLHVRADGGWTPLGRVANAGLGWPAGCCAKSDGRKRVRRNINPDNGAGEQKSEGGGGGGEKKMQKGGRSVGRTADRPLLALLPYRAAAAAFDIDWPRLRLCE